jgi:hypothetical protein
MSIRGCTENGATRQEKVRLWEGDPQTLNPIFPRWRRETTKMEEINL